MFCTNCGSEIDDNAKVCPKCGVPVGTAQSQATQVAGVKSKVVAGLLGIFLGGLGIHKFYLGYTKEAVIMLLVSIIAGIFTFGIASSIIGIIGIVEGILYLTKSDADFEEIYVKNYKGWF